MKYLIGIALLLITSGTAYAMGKTNPVSLRTCGYQMNFCEPYTACVPADQSAAQVMATPEGKLCAKNHVSACAVTKRDGSGNICTVAQGELAWGFLWK